MSTNINTNNAVSNVTAETLRNVRSFARLSNALVLALQDHTDTNLTDKARVKTSNAAATIGTKMLATKNALPSDPAKLRMHVESIKQKVSAIVAGLSNDKSFANHCQRSAIVRNADIALANCETFIAEYKEMKGNATTIVAKVA